MKSILMIDLGKEYGGAEKYIEHLADGIEDKNQIFYVLRKDSLFAKRCKENSRVKNLQIDFTINSILIDILKTIKYIRRHDIKVVHTHGINSEFFACCLRGYLKLKNIRLISTVHGIAEMDRIQCGRIRKQIMARLQIVLLKRFDCVIAVSESIRENLLKKGVDESKIIIIYQSVKVPKFYNYKSIHYPIRLFTMGRLEPIKNIACLIEALEKTKCKGAFKCHVYGDGSQSSDLQEMVKKKKLQDVISFEGYVENVKHIYMTHDVMVQPSIYESFGRSLLEAMSYGVPVICSNVGGMKEIVEDKTSGLLFNVNDADDLKRILENIYYNKYDLEEIRKAGKKRVENVFSEDKEFSAWIELYERI